MVLRRASENTGIADMTTTVYSVQNKSSSFSAEISLLDVSNKLVSVRFQQNSRSGATQCVLSPVLGKGEGFVFSFSTPYTLHGRPKVALRNATTTIMIYALNYIWE